MGLGGVADAGEGAVKTAALLKGNIGGGRPSLNPSRRLPARRSGATTENATLMTENYTLGHDDVALAFVSRRRLDPDGAALLPHLRPGLRVLDCGCGPGTVTADIARAVPGGQAVGVDISAQQVAQASAHWRGEAVDNLEFRQADAYCLPFPEASFDAVFSHALLEHLAEPVAAVREMLRVLKPGGPLVVCTPDWGGFLFSPSTPALALAIAAYTGLQERNGGDPLCGRRLREHLLEAGAEGVHARARYENYQPLSIITELLAWQLERDDQHGHGTTLRQWGQQPAAMFAQAWVSCLGRKVG